MLVMDYDLHIKITTYNEAAANKTGMKIKIMNTNKIGLDFSNHSPH